jgi:hypothetical protein
MYAMPHLKAGVLDEMQIDIIRILLGDGIRLFEGLDLEGLDLEGLELRKTSSIDTPGRRRLNSAKSHPTLAEGRLYGLSAVIALRQRGRGLSAAAGYAAH